MRFTMRLAWLAVIPLVAAASLSCEALARQPAIDVSNIEKAAAEDLAQGGVPGVAIAIVSQDRVVYAKGFGVANAETREHVTPDTLFQVGSVTKMFTAVGALDAARRAGVGADQPIAGRASGLAPGIGRLTLHQLLAQTSGLRDQPGNYGTHGEDDLASFSRSLEDADIFFKPGQVFSYSNPGYALAGYVLQELDRKPYGDAMAASVLRPLGMTRSTFDPRVAMTYPHAVGHEVKKGSPATVVRPLAEDTRITPAGYMFSTASELARFMSAALNAGRLDGRQVIDPGIVQQLFVPHTPLPNLFVNGQYGYGLMMFDDRGVRVAEHAGTTPGFAAVLRFVPQDKLGVAILGNVEAPAFRRTLDRVMETFLQIAPRTPPAPRERTAVPPADAARLAGRYRNRNVMTLAAKDGGLVLEQDGQSWPVSKLAESRFMAIPPGAPAGPEFLVGPDDGGRPAWIHMFLWGFKRE